MRSIRVVSMLVLTVSAVAAGQGQAKRAIRVGDMYRLKNVGDAQVSPEGSWVAYTVSATDSAKDKSDTDIWMTSWDGSQTIQVTSSPDGESSLTRFASPPRRSSSHNCPPLPPWRDDRNERYRPSGLKRGALSPSGEDVTWMV